MRLNLNVIGAVLCILIPGLYGMVCHAQTFPVKPVRLIVAQSAGGGADATARLFTTDVSAGLGRPLVVENRAGVFYLGAEDSVIRPEAAARPLMYKEGQVLLRPLGRRPDADPATPGAPRVDYDMPHEKPWGVDMVLYLFMKAVSTGAMLLGAILWLLGDRRRRS